MRKIHEALKAGAITSTSRSNRKGSSEHVLVMQLGNTSTIIMLSSARSPATRRTDANDFGGWQADVSIAALGGQCYGRTVDRAG